MTKQEIRKHYYTKRTAISYGDRESMSLAIANAALTLPIWEHVFYHIFLPIQKKNEVNTEYLLHILHGKDKNIVVSKSNFQEHAMKHFLLTETTKLQHNAYGIPEPEDGIEIKTQQLEIVFVPLLAFDTSGNRIGYGQGFYDRFLGQCNPDTIKIGLSFFKAMDQPLIPDQYDIKLDYCITPDQVYAF